MVRIGIAQIEPHVGDIDFNLQTLATTLQEAERASVDVLVLPELASSGYAFESSEEAAECSENIPSGNYSERLLSWSKKNRLVVAGICEREESSIFNSAAMFCNGKHIVTYRKAHLFNREKKWFSPGQSEPPVAVFGEYSYGVMICWDWIFPEMTRILALKGAQLVLHPANLVLDYCQKAMQTRALENGVFTATANRLGKERDLLFTGKSQITDNRGEVLVTMRANETGVRSVDINPRDADNKNLTPANHLMDDRRPEIYHRLTDS
jgi:beta-ureidopropionase